MTDFEYCKLRGKIREKFVTETNFAKALGIHKSTLSTRLNKKSQWRVNELQRAIKLLDIKLEEIPSYFFLEASEAK